MTHEVTVFLSKWAPHVWLFGSVFGVLISGALYARSRKTLRELRFADAGLRDTTAFWYRHAAWFLVMHVGYVVVGVLSVLGIRNDWARLVTLFFLLATPLILVYRSYDSLRQSAGSA
jgi:hypothetical protein